LKKKTEEKIIAKDLQIAKL